MTGVRLTSRSLARLRRGLSERDWAVLRSVRQHRLLTTRQVERLHFFEHATPLTAARAARRTLHRLHEHRVLHRLERRVGGVRAGSASYVWSVGIAGDWLLREPTDRSPRRHQDEPSLTFLDHTLAVADAHLALVEAARRGAFELVTVDVEPASWRPFTSPSGAPQTLRPDLYAVTGTDDYEDHWFIEVDRGTESLPALLRKCVQYEAYRRSGLAQNELGTFPLVVWLLPSEQRSHRLSGAIAAHQELDAAPFRVALTADLPAVIACPDHYLTRKEESP